MNERELQDAAKGLPKSIEPPRDLWPGIQRRIGRRSHWYWVAVPLAAAAALVAVLLGRSGPTAWDVVPLAVGRIGQVEVRPGTRVQLIAARADDHRLALARGMIDAKVEAIPRLFFVETAAGTAIDLGCAYTLETDSLGNGLLHVTGGEVEFQTGERAARAPLGAVMQIRPAIGPGIPYVEDAPEPFVHALATFDFENGGARAARTVLALAQPQDAISLWHLMQRVDPSLRGDVYERLAALLPPPAGVTRAAALVLDEPALASYWQKIHRILFRRMILRGVRKIDPITGMTVR